MTDGFNSFYKSIFLKRLFLYGSIALLIYELRNFANLFLMLFFVTYLMNELCKSIHRQTLKVVKVSEGVIITATYFLIIFFLVLTGIKYSPEIVNQTKNLSSSFAVSKDLNNSINIYFNNFLDSIDPSLKNIFNHYNFDFAKKINEFSDDIALFSYNFIKSIGIWIFNIFLLIVLSLFFLIEKNKMKNFMQIFKESKAQFVYEELQPLFVRFYRVFGSIIKTQLIISFINTNLTTLTLAILGFPNLFALSVMIFLFGLIPVAGVIFSTIPLIFIGFNIGGLMYVIYIIILIIIIHILEAYVLFPKIFSNFTHQPIFITLVVLLLSEHLFGPWGLIYGLPLFVFIIESLKSPETINSASRIAVSSKNTSSKHSTSK